MATILAGLNGTGSWQTDARPQDWRESVLYWQPNGMAPLTAITSKAKKRVVTDPRVNYWVQDFPLQVGAITEIYSEPTLNTAVSATTSPSGTAIWLKCAQAVASQCKAGHVLRITREGYPLYSKNVRVIGVVLNGASSYISAITLALDAQVSSSSLANADRFMIVGNVNPEGGPAAPTIMYQPDELYNLTQIVKTSLRLTGTALNTRTRYGTPEYARQKKMTLLVHSLEKEKAALFSTRADGIGDNGQAQRYMMGLMEFATTYAPSDNVASFKDLYSGKKWLENGKDFLNVMLKNWFAYGSTDRFVLCGNGVLEGLSQLAEMYGTIQLSTGASSYGVKISEWITNHGTLQFKSHPLFNQDPDLQYTAVCMNLANVEYCHINGRDTDFIKAHAENVGDAGEDSVLEQWLTEFTYVWGIGKECGIMYDVGKDA